MSTTPTSKRTGKKTPKKIRRGTVYECDAEFGLPCFNALCDLCTARMVDALVPQIQRETRRGKWRAFTLVWDCHQFAYLDLLRVSLKKLGQAIKNVLRRIELSHLGIIAAFDVDLEEVLLGSGVRFWQVHLHGFIRVGDDAKPIKKALKDAFAPAKLSKWEVVGDRKMIRSPVVFKSIFDRVNWTSYSLKEPSRIIDSRRTMFENDKAKRVRHKMNGDDFDIFREFLGSMRVRQRLFLQRYDFNEATGALSRLDDR